MAHRNELACETLSIKPAGELLDSPSPPSIAPNPVSSRILIQIGAYVIVKQLYIGTLIGRSEEVEKGFIVRKKFHRSNLQAIQRNLRCIDIDDDDLSRIGDQV